MIQAISAFAMSCFKLLRDLLDDIKGLTRKFWWGGSKEKRTMYWVNWDEMCKAMEDGGMGFKNLEAFNLAILAKQGWRFLSDTKSHLSIIFKAKYYPMGNFLTAKLGSRPSYVWRSIWSGALVLKNGVRWRIGDGKGLYIGEDPWFPTPNSFKPISPLSREWKLKPVLVLIDENNIGWKEDVINAMFIPYEAELIAGIPLSNSAAPNKIIWHWAKNGNFSVKSTYHQAKGMVENLDFVEKNATTPSSKVGPWKSVWSLNVPNKIKNFFWKACKGILPTAGILKNLRCTDEARCILCGNPFESVTHALLECRWAREVWSLWGSKRGLGWSYVKGNFFDWYLVNLEKLDLAIVEEIVTMCWEIRWRRNEFLHENKRHTAMAILENGIVLLEDFHKVN